MIVIVIAVITSKMIWPQRSTSRSCQRADPLQQVPPPRSLKFSLEGGRVSEVGGRCYQPLTLPAQCYLNSWTLDWSGKRMIWYQYCYRHCQLRWSTKFLPASAEVPDRICMVNSHKHELMWILMGNGNPWEWLKIVHIFAHGSPLWERLTIT